MFGEDPIDIKRLRENMQEESLGAFFGGGFGGALMEAANIQNASDDELIEMARSQEFEIDGYTD